MEASIIKKTSHNSHMPVDRHQPRGFFLHQLQHGKQWRTPKSTINLTAPSRFSNVGKPSPSPGIDGKKNTAQNTPHGKTPRLRILFFVWSPRTSNLSFAKKPSQEFCCSKILHWKGIHILRVPSPRNHELRMHRRSGSSQYTALGQRLGKVRFVYHPIGRAENEIKSKLKVKDCLSTLRSKSTSYLPGLRIARTGSKPNETQKEPWGFHHCPQALLWVAPPQNKIKLGIKKKGFIIPQLRIDRVKELPNHFPY